MAEETLEQRQAGIERRQLPAAGDTPNRHPDGVDRLIQQAIAQQLSAIVDKDFSYSSYGFRPGHNAWQAV